MAHRIGFPRCLYYYAYFPFWKGFFETIGVEVVSSPPTSKEILDRGVKEAISDICMPIKLAFGHLLALPRDLDYIFLPRYVNVSKEDHVTFCPKFLALPDLVRATLNDLPPLLTPRIAFREGRRATLRTLREIASTFGVTSFWTVYRAYRRALDLQRRYDQLLQQGYLPDEAMAVLAGRKVDITRPEGDLTIAVVGFPYDLYDSFISLDLIKKLRSYGVRVVTPEMIPPQVLKKQLARLPKNLFWEFSNRVIRAALHYLHEEKVDGIIHVIAFACGPGTFVDKMIELETKELGQVPFLSLTIDEHTGQAGFLTRLEAFVDMMRLRRMVS